MAGNVYICAGCNKLSISERRHETTCSGACRVRAHRNGVLRELKSIAEPLEVTPAHILQCKALMALRPDLADKIAAGKLTIKDAMPDVCNAFWKVLQAHLEVAS